MASYASTHTALRRPEDGVVDELFWLAKLDDNVPRAHIPPHFRRSSTAHHTYEAVPFTLDPQVVQALKSVDTARGISDVALCASLVTVLFSKYQRHDALVVGLQRPVAEDDDRTVVPLRLPCGQSETAHSLMRGVTEETAELLRQIPPPIARLAQLLGVEATAANRCPFFDVAIAVDRGQVVFDFDRYPVDMAILFAVSGGSINGRLVYAADLFDAPVMRDAVTHLLNAASAMSREPFAKVADIDILTPNERRRVLDDFAGATVPFRLDTTIPALFEEQVRRTPEAVAVIHGSRTVTYAEVNVRANRLAHALLSRGLRKGDFVCILLDRSAEFVTAMLAIFKAGGAYVPLDPTYPDERVRYMLEDSKAAFVISNAALEGNYEQALRSGRTPTTVLSVDGSIPVTGIESANAENPAVGLEPRDRAYMIYTSGSTGRPKGAICRHDGALNHLYGELHGLGIDEPVRFLQTAASSSDISVWQLVAPLVTGGATVIADYDVVLNPSALFVTVRDHRVTVAELVPVVLRALVDYVAALAAPSRELPDLQFMMATGEALPTTLVERWLALYPRTPIANTYGPTETSDDVTLLVLREPLPQRQSVVPIGRPLPNTHIFILDRYLQPVPVGIPGEICIAGIGVGEGYWQQPDKTRLAFVPCPFAEQAGGLMYRSGDLGRWLADGSVEFLGRLDQQVKVRGFRVEPGEIEAALTRHPAIQNAVVVAATDAAGTNRLVGYYVLRKGERLETAELRQFLKSTLADHMIPVLIPLSAIPLTPLGKVDRKAIERLQDEEHIADSIFESPRNRREEAVADAWSKVLGRQRIGIHENFFEIGGHSISTIQIIAELRKSGLRLLPKQFFLYPTIAALAQIAEAVESIAADTALEPPRGDQDSDSAKWRKQLEPVLGPITDVYPLGATQQGIYLQTVLSSRSSGAYIEQIAFDLSGNLDEDAFGKAWQHVVNSTDVLRTAVLRRGVPHPVQAVLRTATLTPEVVDWRNLDDAGQTARYRALLEHDRRRGFDLRTPPLMRVTLIRLGDERKRVLWTYHHIILDGWSEPLVLRAVLNAYTALQQGRLPQPEAGGRFRDFVAWCAQQNPTPAKAFWQSYLAGFTTPVSIGDGSAAIESPASAEISHGAQVLLLSHEETSRIEQMARRTKLTLGTLIHGAWAVLLHARTGAADVVFGSVSSGRQSGFVHADALRGVLVNTQPLRSRAVPDTTISSWLRLLQVNMAEMREHEHTALGLIQQWCEVPLEKRPLFDTIVVLANYAGSDLADCQLPGVCVSDVAYYTQPLFALTLFVAGGDRLSIQLVYDRKRYALSTVRQLLDDYRRILTSIAENPEQSMASLTAPR